MATYQKVIQLKSSEKEDAEFVSYTVKRRIANEKIKHAMEKVNDVYNRMEEELIKAKKERTLARNNLVHAIYGVQVGELPEEKDISEVLKNVSRSSIFNDRGGEKKVKYNAEAPTEPTCGGTGESGAGFTLINDFYCLCVGKDSNHTACHEKIRGPGKWKNDSVDDTIEKEYDCKKDCKDGSCPCCQNSKCCSGECQGQNGKCYCPKNCDCGKWEEVKKCCGDKCSNCNCQNCCQGGSCDSCKCEGCNEGCHEECQAKCKAACEACKACKECRKEPYGILNGEWLKLNVSGDETVEFEKGWPHIRNVCKEAFPDTINTTAESIQEVLDKFNEMLGNNKKNEIKTSTVEYDARRLFVLGHLKEVKHKEGCNGKYKHNNNSDIGVCVNYWSVSNLGMGIVWQNYMLEAQKHLQEMDKHVKKALQLSAMIQKLKDSAEESYRNSGHSSLLWSEDYGPKGCTFFNFFIFFACLF